MNIGTGGFTLDPDDSPDLLQHVVEVGVCVLDCQLRVRQDPDVNVQRFEVRVFGDTAELEGTVGLCDGSDGYLVRVNPLRSGCEPAVSEVDLGWIRRSSL